ncbi:diacylglycerol/lipid kinase family protein [Tundrisphaera lichenicola]|uniref:diacylglycerol/lipid kinase family protein n=1 Tax=Tundrisphaera lichenicola TaxID=2029860 RepID=UPI003EBD9E10
MTLESNLATEESRTGRKARAFVVLNPRSGSCTAPAVRRAIRDHLGDLEVEVHEISEGDDIQHIVLSAIERGCDPIVAAGGDGTVSSIANVMVGKQAHLVILPLGTANVLARELGIPVELEGACRLGAHRVKLGSLTGPEHEVFRLDAMKVGNRHYFTQIGVGIDALMIRDTATEQKKRFGRLAYLWTAATRLVGFQPRKFSIVIDGEEIIAKASEVVIANTGMMGQPPFRWGPDIRADDGRLNVCIVRARTFLDYAGIFWLVVQGRHRESPNVRYRTASKSVEITTKHPLPVQADGEIVGDTPIRVEVVPNAVEVVIPSGTQPGTI